MQKKMFGLCLFLVAFTSCGDSIKSSIPDVSVNFSCSLLQSPYFKIKTEGQFLSVPKDNHGIPVGYGGLIIGLSVHPDLGYLAFDAACPVEVKSTVSVEIQDDGLGTAVCPVCGTKYSLSGGGYPENRDGGEYLKSYRISVSGDRLQVTN